MTNEEAIMILKAMIDDMILVFDRDRKKALNMAIEALKEQQEHSQNTSSKQPDLDTFGVKTEKTCADAISRQDAIEELSYLQTYLFDSRDHDNKVSLEDVRYDIEQLPSVQPEQRWIPCSERLPENDERVLATTAWGDVTIAERIYPPIDDTCWFIHDGNTNATIDDVVAWMPLPEPYKGES